MSEGEGMTFSLMRDLVIGERVTQRQPARVCAHMLSILAKREARGEGVPEWGDLLKEATERE